MIRRLLALVAVWVALTAAAPGPAPLPLVPPPPDLTRLVPFAAAPLEKPPVTAPEPPLPQAQADMPPLPLAPVVVPAADKPTAFLPPSRTLPCVGAWLRIATESLECGIAKFGRGEFEEAARALDAAVRAGPPKDVLVEARYWLGESLYRLGRAEQADWLFRQVAQDSPRHEYGVFALHSSGWTALRLLDPARARQTFSQVLSGPVPTVLQGWTQHGMALANYALARHQEASRLWVDLAARGVPLPITRDVSFWRGESFGRVGQYDNAVADLTRFVGGGPHPLLAAGLVRLGWWGLHAGKYAEATNAFRTYLSGASPGGVPERDWAEAGLALAHFHSGDTAGALTAARALQGRRSAVALPVFLRFIRVALDASRPAEAQTTIQELLSLNLTPTLRSWLLLIKGEALRLEGNRDEARTQYDLARRAEPGSVTGVYASYRLAQTNFEMREFAQAVTDVTPIVTGAAAGDLRLAGLVLQGEAAYYAGDYVKAATAFRRAITEFPQAPGGPAMRLALAWTELRQDRTEPARRAFTDFAAAHPDHPAAADALVLASELALTAGDLEGARQIIDSILSAHPTHPRADFARLNRALLMLRAGEVTESLPILRDWVARAPFPPLLGRAQAALGVALLALGQPADAGKAFTQARREGVGALANLGLGAAALGQQRWDEAERELKEARESGTAAIGGVAEYGLAAIAFQRGAVAEFKKPAAQALAAWRFGPGAPQLLYVLTGIAVAEKDWTGALATAKRLASEFPNHETADDALERVGAGAAAPPSPAWPVVQEAYTLLRQRYPRSPFVAASSFTLAEAHMNTGKPAEARQELERFVAGAPADDARLQPALIMLARAREAAGDRKGALDAYARAARDGRGAEWSRDAMLGHARLLTQDRRYDQARTVLERLVKTEATPIVVEASTAIGETYTGEGEHLAAAEYYMTAAYLAPDTPAGRRAMLEAAKSFIALKQPDAAAALYRKLLAQAGVPADVAEIARQGLRSLGR
jgi:tetratricopeptide (TPR) repeat protein